MPLTGGTETRWIEGLCPHKKKGKDREKKKENYN